MKIRLLFFSALIAYGVSASAVHYAYKSVPNDLTKARIYTLSNGLKVYLSVNKEKPRIQTYIAVRTGSKNDPAETTGLAHYLEHLMFKGTKQYGVTDPVKEAPLLDEIEARYEEYRHITDSEKRRQKYHEIDSVSQIAAKYFIPNEYDKLMSAIGAIGTNAYTSNDVTCYVEDIPSNEIENWAKIQSDRFMNMVIRGFHTELEAVYEEYNIGIAQDNRKLWETMSKMLFPSHPYGTQTTIGTQEHLKNPSITNIKNYFDKWYRPNNVAICMAGDLDPDKTIEIIERYFGEWKEGADVQQPVFPTMAPITEPRDTTIIGLEAETLWLGWRFDKGNSLQTDTLSIISNMLSNGTAGLIDLNINQQMKMLRAWAGHEILRDYSCFIMGGTPNEGQTLDEVRALLLNEIHKLRNGNFSDDLLPSVINNIKLDYQTSLEANSARANKFVYSYINEIEWEQEVGYLDRISKITKQDVINFANKYFVDNYVIVNKRQGEDTTLKKIDKPAITPIPTNRELVSQFVKDIQNTPVEPIEPKFVDFDKDLTLYNAKGIAPMAYVRNNENNRFTLIFRFPFGEENDIRYSYAGSYIDLLGTDKLTNEQIKQQFYKLACNYNMLVGTRNIHVELSGLSDNMPQALSLLNNILSNAKVDKDAWEQYVSQVEKSRSDNKLNQRANFQALILYGLYGPYNSWRNIMSVEQLRQSDPQEFINLLKDLPKHEYTLLYYGPMSEKELAKAIKKEYKVKGSPLPNPAGKPYVMQSTTNNEVLIAPYEAKNIYMRMIHNEQKMWTPEESAVKALFNEYYGGGMNTIVFQELREARGLAYNAYASYNEPFYKEQPEYFFTHVITQNDKMMDCIRQFNTILDTIPESENAFRIAKESLTKRLASQRTTKFGIINSWINAKELGINYPLAKRIYNDLPNVTLSDVVTFERNAIAKKPYRYIILGDEKELDIESLKNYGPIKRISTEEIFGY